ncbi:hypothetical protein ASF62_11870 [Leifsonia sp. Leaf325]|nr:hypothetical protein ASF62_11870 [Leifsonia sp. Leaf325]
MKKAQPVDPTVIDLEGLLFDDSSNWEPGRSTKFDLRDVAAAVSFVERSGVLDDLAKYRDEARVKTGPGGAPSMLTDLHIVAGWFLLAKEHTPLWVSELARLLATRLTPEARRYLDLPPAADDWYDIRAKRKWYNAAHNRMKTLLVQVDPFPGIDRRNPTNREGRAAFKTARELNTERRMKDRLDKFSNDMVEQTWREMPREYRRRRAQIDVTADQSFVTTGGKRGMAKKDKNGVEMWDPKVMEPEMNWHITNSGTRDDGTAAQKEAAKNKDDAKWGAVANLTIITSTRDTGEKALPNIAIGFSLSTPAIDPEIELVRLGQSIIDRGHTPGRMVADRGYFASKSVEKLHIPIRDQGWGVVTDYVRTQLGKHGEVHGAQQIEGAHYCPAMPASLRDASVDAEAQRIDEETYRNYIKMRVPYEVRPKERPDEDGNQRVMCPAYGANAKVVCPFRMEDEKPEARTARLKRMKTARVDIPVIQEVDLPARKYDICKCSSITLKKDDGIKHKQELRYGSELWDETYDIDRSISESYNAYMKDQGRENAENSERRRVRGMAANQFLVTFLVISANMRKIFDFIHEEKAVERTGVVKTLTRSKSRNSTYRSHWFKKRDPKPASPPGGEAPPPTPMRT